LLSLCDGGQRALSRRSIACLARSGSNAYTRLSRFGSAICWSMMKLSRANRETAT
jgi:hypothetical protein